MRILILIISVANVSCCCLAQSLQSENISEKQLIINASKYKIGIYKNFDDFNLNVYFGYGSSLPMVAPKTNRYIISIKSGKIYALDPNYFKQLCEKTDQELLVKFSNENSKKSKLLDYIKQYNKRYYRIVY